MSRVDPREIAIVLRTLRLLGAHAISLTGSRTTGMAIVHEAVRRHPRPSGSLDGQTLACILAEITEACRHRQGGTDLEPTFGVEFMRLPFEARTCVSLRINFGMEFREIGPIISMPGREAELLYAETIRRLEDADGPCPFSLRRET